MIEGALNFIVEQGYLDKIVMYNLDQLAKLNRFTAGLTRHSGSTLPNAPIAVRVKIHLEKMPVEKSVSRNH